MGIWNRGLLSYTHSYDEWQSCLVKFVSFAHSMLHLALYSDPIMSKKSLWDALCNNFSRLLEWFYPRLLNDPKKEFSTTFKSKLPCDPNIDKMRHSCYAVSES